MEKFEISIACNNQNYHFEVKDYMHHDGEQCKFEVFKDDEFIAGFEPDHTPHKHLYLCKNAGMIDEEILNLIAERIEASNL